MSCLKKGNFKCVSPERNDPELVEGKRLQKKGRKVVS